MYHRVLVAAILFFGLGTLSTGATAFTSVDPEAIINLVITVMGLIAAVIAAYYDLHSRISILEADYHDRHKDIS